jgi:uncharacterized integral membrane protein (TIGR00697 family)
MNETLLFLHILIVMAFVLSALRMGKGALMAILALQTVLANLFVTKQMSLFGFVVTCSDVFVIGSVFASNLIQEYFGKEEAVRAVRISFLGLVFFALMSQMHLLYAPSSGDETSGAFSLILSATPRIVLASIAVFYIVQRVDLVVFAWIKKRFEGQKLPLRMGISLVFSQFLDTVLFSFLGLYGVVESVFDIILVSFLIKCLIIACSSPLVSFAKRFRREVA